MSRYREIYEILSGTTNPHHKPLYTDDLLRDAGIETYANDERTAGLEAAVVYLAERVRDLEEKVK